MTFDEAKSTLLETWGTLGSSWGINRTMAQIHILLLISPEPLSAEDVMKELNISRGNVNMNMRALMDWGVVYKKLVPGERKEFFYPEKDIWELMRIVARERRKRELDPALRILKQMSRIDSDGSKEVEEFKKMTRDLEEFSEMADQALQMLSRQERSKLLKLVMAIA
jgi:DNA-binding transcriptional regulator GbsR (MarR family)